MADYIPPSDPAFSAWSRNFLTYLMGNIAALGLLPADVTPIGTGVTGFDMAFSAHNTAAKAAQGAKETKNSSRTTAEQAIRSLVRRIQANPAITDAQRAGLGITVHDKARTMAVSENWLGRPIAMVDTSQRLRHEISFTDENTPTSKARPHGVIGCEIWVKVSPSGEALPKDPSELTFVALDTATPYVTEFSGDDAGKTAHYMSLHAPLGQERP